MVGPIAKRLVLFQPNRMSRTLVAALMCGAIATSLSAQTLVQGTNGSLCGTTLYFGAHGEPDYGGTVFAITPAGSLTTLHNFCSQSPECADGEDSWATLALATSGDFYGSTTYGGAPAAFHLVSGSEITASVPEGATSGKVGVATPAGTLLSNVAFRVMP
jgi:uncharacterized repeat protein (TIGR03803 family)